MSLYGAFDQTKHLDELDDPLESQGEGVLTAATRRLRVLRNIVDSTTITLAQVLTLDAVTAGTVAASKALVVDSSKDLSELGLVTAKGLQNVATAITATSDGLTTGLIPSNSGFVAVTSASAVNIITMPAAVVGMVIKGYVGANGCEIRTPAAGTDTINGIDTSGPNEAAIPATTLIKVTCSLAGEWILEATTELGAVITAIIPDAV